MLLPGNLLFEKIKQIQSGGVLREMPCPGYDITRMCVAGFNFCKGGLFRRSQIYR